MIKRKFTGVKVKKIKTLVAAAVLMTVTFTTGGGVAHAEGVIADPPTTPAEITVKNPAKPQPLLQPPVEWTVYAQPYSLVKTGYSEFNYSMFGLVKNIPPVAGLAQPSRYSLFYDTAKECNAQLIAEAKSYGPLNLIYPPHLVWMAKNDWVENLSNKCYQIYNGMWVYEYINHFESPGIKNIEGIPGHFPKDVPAEQQKYLRK